MKKIIVVLSIVAVFIGTIITTIHSFSDLQEHFIHLLTLGAISLLFILYILKDTIKIKNQFATVTLVLLLTFCIVRVFSCHILLSNPGPLAQTTIIDNPCCSAVIDAIPTIAIAPTSENVTFVEQKPFIAPLPRYTHELSNKSPPPITV